MIRLLLILAITLFAVGTVMPLVRPIDRESAGEVQSGYRINVNIDDASTMTLLPGIGPALARRIAEYRQEHGPYKSIDDLKKVRGIGDVIAERLRPYATVGELATSSIDDSE